MNSVSLVDGHIDEPKFTDGQIMKALECCSKKDCKQCPAYDEDIECGENIIKFALDLINRQKAEIERLNKEVKYWEAETRDARADIDKAVAEAAKEVVERLKSRSHTFKTEDRILVKCIPFDYVDTLLKEMDGD